ncbi:MAG: DUF4038 domain-containing protein, partial [Bacteroidia bacterium]|nr:DUF4038 domain-containing protein [Bacteroidia bacterium]
MINKPVFDPNSLVRHFFVFLIFIIISSCSTSTYKEITPLLTVSENRRFLETKSGDPFFWLGDTGWLLFAKLSREETEKYLEDRRQKGFNVIQVMVLHDVRNSVNVYGDSALINNRIDQPLTTPGNSFNDSFQYDFWDHIDYVVGKAGKKG